MGADSEGEVTEDVEEKKEQDVSSMFSSNRKLHRRGRNDVPRVGSMCVVDLVWIKLVMEQTEQWRL
ncbi:hypothetical protein BHE74_00046222, partial [Ensete ventricosum]